MKPSERLKVFEEELKGCGANPPEYFRARDIHWLINRVKRLTEALEEISQIQHQEIKHSWGGQKHQQIARKALEENE